MIPHRKDDIAGIVVLILKRMIVLLVVVVVVFCYCTGNDDSLNCKRYCKE